MREKGKGRTEPLAPDAPASKRQLRDIVERARLMAEYPSGRAQQPQQQFLMQQQQEGGQPPPRQVTVQQQQHLQAGGVEKAVTIGRTREDRAARLLAAYRWRIEAAYARALAEGASSPFNNLGLEAKSFARQLRREFVAGRRRDEELSPDFITFQLNRWPPFFASVIVAACKYKTGQQRELSLSRKLKDLDVYATELYHLTPERRETIKLLTLDFIEQEKRRNADFAKRQQPAYTPDAPTSGPAATSRRGRMPERNGFNKGLALSRYEVLARHVDLLNPRLPQAEKLARAERLVAAFKRLRKVVPDFEDRGEQMQAANRIRTAAYRHRKRAKEAAI